MNRKRLALSAFVIGVIIAPLAIHGRSDWSRVADRITWKTEDFWQRNHTRSLESRSIRTPDAPPIVYGPAPTDRGNYYPDQIHPGGGYDGPTEAVPPLIVVTARLLSWLLAVLLGGLSTAILGYFIPTFCTVAFGGVPSVLRSYVRWLNGPGA
jgi:hypothetical protein